MKKDKQSDVNAYTRKSLLSDATKAHSKDSAYKRADTLEFMFTLIMVIVAVFAFRLFIFEPVRVDGESMQTTLMDNERMFVEKLSVWTGKIDRGEIVIVYFPNRGSDTFVKRVVGLPGEKLQVKNGVLYIDNKQLDESKYWHGTMNQDYGPIMIPNDSVFVMGDNRNFSGDSRQGRVGPIPIYRIIGRVRGVIWPLSLAREV
ncbi:MAG: signal peptidase I [Clostridia bacterium]